MQQNNSISWELGELLGNPKGTKSFSSWSEFTDFVNEMPIKTIQPFVSNFNAFAGEGFYGNVVQGLVIKQLEDAVFIFGIAIDGTLIFRKRNYPDVSTWEDPKIIIHSNNWHKIYFVTDLGGLLPVVSIKNNGVYPMGTQIIDNSNGSFFAMKIIINRSSENGWLCIDVTTMGDTFFSKAVLYVGKNIVRHVVYAEKGGNPNRACYYDINNNTITIIYKPGDYGSFTRLNVTSLYDRSDTIAAEFISKMPDLNGFTKIETN